MTAYLNTIVLVTGGFDPIHSGHISLFNEAKIEQYNPSFFLLELIKIAEQIRDTVEIIEPVLPLVIANCIG